MGRGGKPISPLVMNTDDIKKDEVAIGTNELMSVNMNEPDENERCSRKRRLE